MPSLSQSPLLQALGYAIAHSLWQMAMVWIVYVLLNSLFKFKSEIKYRIAVAAQVVGFTWFIGTLQFYYAQCSQALKLAKAIYLESGDQATVVLDTKSTMLSLFIKAEQVLPYLSVAYLVLLLFLTIRWFRAYRYTQLVRLNGLHKIDVDWKLFVNKVAGQLGIKRKVRIYLSELVKSPVTMGFLKPVILIPIASINHLTPQQLEAVILHELAHIRRHDYLLNILLSIIDLALFFNPFTRLITKSVSKERENSCDDWVLQYQYSPAMYAEALLRIAVMQKAPAMAMYAAKTKSELVSRVDRMINQRDSRFNYRHQLIALLLMTGILTSIAWYDPNGMKNKEAKATSENKAIVLEPLAAKVDNPLFNPVFFLNEPLKEEVKQNVEARERQIRHLGQSQELAVREIRLPEVMAPVAIENLKELERNLNSTVNKQLRKVWAAMPQSQYTWGQQLQQYQAADIAYTFAPGVKFDTLRIPASGVFYAPASAQFSWKAFSEEIESSRKEIEASYRKGDITHVELKKMQAQLSLALSKMKDFQFANIQGVNKLAADGMYFLNNLAATESAEEEREAAEELRTAERKITEARTRAAGNNAKQRKVLLDSMKARGIRLANQLTTKQGQAYLYAYSSGAQSPLVLNEVNLALEPILVNGNALAIATLPVNGNNQAGSNGRTVTGTACSGTGNASSPAPAAQGRSNQRNTSSCGNTTATVVANGKTFNTTTTISTTNGTRIVKTDKNGTVIEVIVTPPPCKPRVARKAPQTSADDEGVEE